MTLIERIDNAIAFNKMVLSDKQLSEELNGLLQECKEALSKQPVWVSVEDRLPERQKIVWGWGSHSVAWPVFLHKDGKWYDAYEPDDKPLTGIKSWTPLPTPPESEQ